MNNVKKCMNIKSKHYKNLQCSNKATSGDYCSKHSKNPIRFSSALNISASLIQKTWRNYVKRFRFRRQGPASNDYTLANNSTDLYSLESIESIPKKYFFSFSDSKKNIWAFDIRTLSFMLSKSKKVENPYNREYLSEYSLNKIKNRIEWLKLRKYPVFYKDNVILTSDQMWNQSVLDIFSEIEECGYLVNTDWFHNLEKEDHILFYKKLYEIWNYKILLTDKEKNLIVPGFNGRKKLFKYNFTDIDEKEEKYLKKMNLGIIQKFVSSTQDKSLKSQGAIYVLKSLCHVSDNFAEAFPWLHDSSF